MKKSNFLWTLMAMPLMMSCSNDMIDEGGGNVTPDVDGVYISVLLNPSSGTRSTTNGDDTSSSGVEVGTDVENKINEVLIVLAKRNNELIATTTTKDFSQAFATGQTYYKTTAELNKTTLSSYYNGGGDGNVNVFVFCNPTNGFKTEIAKDEYLGAATWTDIVWTYKNETTDLIWDKENGFMMSNQSMALRNLPSNLDGWKDYSSKLHAFDLSGNNAPGTSSGVDNLTNRGAIPVCRMAARLDFRDGSQMTGDGYNGLRDPNNPYTYAMVKRKKADATEEVIVNCKIYALALTNMSKTEYYLKRVSKNGLLDKTTSNGYLLCGAEMPWTKKDDGSWADDNKGNYVVSTNAAAKKTGITTGFDNYFAFPFFDTNNQVSSKGIDWDWKQCSSFSSAESDNYGQKEYKVWRYVTENTLPGDESNQKNGQSTGIVFKARMLATDILKNSADKWEKMLYEALTYNASSVGDDKNLHNNSDTDPILYSLAGNTLYVTWHNVQAAALAEAGFDATKETQTLDRNAPLYRLVYGTGGVGKIYNDEGELVYDDTAVKSDDTSANSLWIAWDNARKEDPTQAEDEKSAFKAKATGLGFTLYQSSKDDNSGDWGYYCYYYYWNRHNDNNNPSLMGPMEFAVVRNNVYKLAVTKLNVLGHPRIPENDPEKPKPDDPNEKSKVYLTLRLDVVPWVVRINNIEF